MSHNSQRKLRSILNKDVLTGFEVAKITMSALYEWSQIANPELYGMKCIDSDDKFRIMPLTDTDLKELQINNLKGHDDRINEYNNWLGGFSHILSLIDHAHIMCLSVEKILSFSTLLIERYINEAIIKSAMMNTPDVLNPSSAGAKKGGHFTRGKNIFDDIRLMPLDAALWESIGKTPTTFLTIQIQKVKSRITLFLFSKTLLNILTEETGINFSKHMDCWYESIKYAIDVYTDTLSSALILSSRAKSELNGIPETINLSDIQLSRGIEEKFRERLSRPLEGHVWVSECKKLFYEEMASKSDNWDF
jgi:hypothetical protein